MPDRRVGEYEDPSAAEVALESPFRNLRQVLDRIVWPPARAVDLFAFFLLDTRLRIGLEFRRVLQQAAFDPGMIGERAAGWLPWHPEETRRRVRAEFAELSQFWLWLAPELDRTGLTVEDLVQALNPHLAPATVSAARWGRWTFRACSRACESLSEGEWRELFARLYAHAPLEEQEQ